MSLLTPNQISVLAKAVDSFRREQLEVLAGLDYSSDEYANQQEFLIQIENTLSNVKLEWEKLRKENSKLMPFDELIRDGA